jgi:hypothetical protein
MRCDADVTSCQPHSHDTAPQPQDKNARCGRQTPHHGQDSTGVIGLHHTSHVTRHTSPITRHTSHVTHHTTHVTRHTSHVTRHTSHVIRHTSYVTRHTSHFGHLLRRRYSSNRLLHHIYLPAQAITSSSSSSISSRSSSSTITHLAVLMKVHAPHTVALVEHNHVTTL